MKNMHITIRDKHKHSVNKNWLRVLEFGAGIDKCTAKKQSQQTDTPQFVVLP